MSELETMKNLTTEQKQAILDEANTPEAPRAGEVVTEVTSLAKEEERTGVKVEVPTAEKLVARASFSLFSQRKKAAELLGTMSKKQIIRAVTAFLDLPTEGLPVFLKDDKEKLLFAVGQRAIQDRFIIIQHHINQQIALERIKQQEKQNEG